VGFDVRGGLLYEDSKGPECICSKKSGACFALHGNTELFLEKLGCGYFRKIAQIFTIDKAVPFAYFELKENNIQ